MILWEEKSPEPDGFLTVTHTTREGGGPDSRVKDIFTVSSLLKELPHLKKPVLNALPWQREKYERWARVRPVSGWGSLCRSDPHQGGLSSGQPGSAVERAWSLLQDPNAARSTAEMGKSANVVCPSIDSIIRHYKAIDYGGLSTFSRR